MKLRREYNNQKQTFADVLQNRCLPEVKASNFIKKRLQYRGFAEKFPKYLKTPFSTEHHGWLLLNGQKVVHAK